MTTAKTTTRKTKAAPKKRTPRAPRIDSLPVNPFVFEVLDLTSKQKTKPKNNGKYRFRWNQARCQNVPNSQCGIKTL